MAAHTLPAFLCSIHRRITRQHRFLRPGPHLPPDLLLPLNRLLLSLGEFLLVLKLLAVGVASLIRGRLVDSTGQVGFSFPTPNWMLIPCTLSVLLADLTDDVLYFVGVVGVLLRRVCPVQRGLGGGHVQFGEELLLLAGRQCAVLVPVGL